MRLSVLYAGGALAASLLLSACASGGTSQGIPNGAPLSVVNPMHLHRPPAGMFKVRNLHRDTVNSCSNYQYGCIDVNQQSPGGPYIENACTASGYTCAPEYWLTTTITNLNGKPNPKRWSNYWSPNPFFTDPSDNVSYQYITLNRLPYTRMNGKPVASLSYIQCDGGPGLGNCWGPWTFGIIAVNN
jgi:hypothetical protein